MPRPDDVRRELTGIGIGRRSVPGPVIRMAPPLPEPSTAPSIEDAGTELEHARTALRGVAEALREHGTSAGGAAQDVLEAQALMAADPALDDAIALAVNDGRTAARAVFDAFTTFRDALAVGGPYLAERVADLDDVRQRAVAACLGVPVPGVPDPGHPYVLVARDLAPADAAGLDLSTVLALVTSEGGPTSHTAVLARSRGIPAVVGCAGAAEIPDGTPVLVDPAYNRLVVCPGSSAAPDAPAIRDAVPEAIPGPGWTADGRPIALLANIDGPGDVEAAVRAGAEGVGLFRTELLFLDADNEPSEREQVAVYRKVFGAFPNGRIVVRVLDAGTDKPLRFLAQEPEPNPALGVRGTRALRKQPSVLRTQLAAIAAAQRETGGYVWVMAPMIADAAEAAWFVEQAKAHGLATAGVMIEVPSAAMLADQIFDVAAFVSIGTNDLAQYGLAVDRQAGGLTELQDPWHPGLLRMVDMTCRAGAAAGLPVGVCGEAAADPELACVLVGLGVKSLSMAPAAIADVRTALSHVDLAQCRRMADRALLARTAQEARAAARRE